MAQKPYFGLTQDEFHQMMSNDTETHERIFDLEDEIKRLRAERAAVAQRIKQEFWEDDGDGPYCSFCGDDWDKDSECIHHVARRAPDAESAHDKMLDALNEMAADRSWDGQPEDH